MPTIAPNTYRQTRSIGGSDAAAVMGRSRYKTPAEVYDAIVGHSAPRPVDGDRGPTERGRALEEWIVKLYERQQDRITMQVERAWSKEHPFLHASPDRLVTDLVETGLLEVKAPGTYVLKQWKAEGIPPEYYIQMQHYMFVLGLKWGHFCAFDYDAFDVWVVPVARDESTIAEIVERCTTFWLDYVERGVRPPETANDGPPEMRWPKGRPGAPKVRTDAEWLQAEHALSRAATDYKLAEAALAVAKEKVKTLMGEDEEISGTELRVTWKEGTSRSFDIKGFLAAKGVPEEETKPFVRTKATRVFNLYPVKEGK